MHIYYDKRGDYLEFFFEQTANYADADEKNDNVVIFRSEKDDSIVGYAIEDAAEGILHFDNLDTVDKLAILLKISRLRRDLSQDEVAKQLHISLRHYQRLEVGQDTTVSLLAEISHLFPEMNFGSLFETKKTG